MGAKLSKKGSKAGDAKAKEEIVEPALTTFDKTATLPASFRKRNVNQEPMTSPTSPRGPGLNRNASFSKRFRKSCRNWAVQKGIVDPKEKEGEQKEETATSVEAAKPAPVRRNSCPDAAEVAEVTKEDDLAAVVASLVVEAQKKKAASRSASREVLNEPSATDDQAAEPAAAASEAAVPDETPVEVASTEEVAAEVETVKQETEQEWVLVEADEAKKAEEADATKKAEEEAEEAKKLAEEAAAEEARLKQEEEAKAAAEAAE